MEWSLEKLTKFIDAQLEGHGFEKDESNLIAWLPPGMTPIAAEQVAINLLEAQKQKTMKEAGEFVDHFAGFL